MGWDLSSIDATLHQIPSQTWQNMPSFGTERLNPKGVKPFFMPVYKRT